uniref:Eph LBD domain-containing protein n=1 Tax=Meloidogyne hapla TaxID=6305 RepID=A0A1I8B085_MELHA
MDLSAMMPLLYLRGLLLLLLSFSTLYSTRALKVYLLDTLNATSELNWRTYSNQDEKDGWLEETMYSRSENKNHQVYSTCNYESNHDAENWLLIPGIERGEAERFYLHFNFTIVRCAAVEALRTSGCKETLKLYASQFNESEEKEFVKKKNWYNETKWDYVDTLASHSTTDTANNNKNEIEMGNIEENLQKQQEQNQQQTYTQTSSYDVKKRFVHFALRNTGACSSILSVKIYYNVCPEYFSSLLHLPRTVSARDPHGVVSVQGRCTSNSSPVATLIQHPPQPPNHHKNDKNLFGTEKIVRRQFPALQAPTAICKADGTWQLVGSSTECVCDQGYVVSKINGMCTGV